MILLDSDEIKLLSKLDEKHRKKWLISTGYSHGLTELEETKFLELFNQLIDEWDSFDVLKDVILDLLRIAVLKLYSEDVTYWSWQIAMNYRTIFELKDYLQHFMNTFNQYEAFNGMFDHLPDKKKTFIDLCAKDYFFKIAKDAFEKDYTSILREKKIKDLLK